MIGGPGVSCQPRPPVTGDFLRPGRAGRRGWLRRFARDRLAPVGWSNAEDEFYSVISRRWQWRRWEGIIAGFDSDLPVEADGADPDSDTAPRSKCRAGHPSPAPARTINQTPASSQECRSGTKVRQTGIASNFRSRPLSRSPTRTAPGITNSGAAPASRLIACADRLPPRTNPPFRYSFNI